jgi:hypothetical protein
VKQTEIDSISRWFDGYTRSFEDGQGRLLPMLQIKLDHSRRVADIMQALARDTGLPDDDVRTALALGLLHDVGRFTQFAQYHTLDDRVSVNHGLRGVAVLDEFQPLAGCVMQDRLRIVAGVRCHNAHHLPDDVEPGILYFVKMIRDADKLDICRTLMSAWETGEMLKRPEIVFNIDMEGPPNPAAVADLREKRTVAYAHLRSITDFFLTLLSWVYDLNFSASYRRLAEWNMVEKIARELPPDAQVQEAAQAAVQFYRQQLRDDRPADKPAAQAQLRASGG